MSSKQVVYGKVASVDLIEDHPIFKSRILLQDRSMGMIVLYVDSTPRDNPYRTNDTIRCDVDSVGAGEWFCKTSEICKVIPISQSVQFPPRDGEDRILIDRIIDGDTVSFYYLIPDKGRLVGYDAPELHGETKDLGIKAKEHLGHLLPEGSVQTVKFNGRDKYGRSLLIVPEVKEKMIESGNGKLWDGTGGR